MLGGLSVVIGLIAGMVSLVVTGTFDGVEKELINETIPVEEVSQMEIKVEPEGEDGLPEVTLETTQPSPEASAGEAPTPTPTTTPTPTPTSDEEKGDDDKKEVDCDDNSYSEVYLEVNGEVIDVCDDDGDGSVEKNIETENGNVSARFNQNVNVSGNENVSSKTRVNISTD